MNRLLALPLLALVIALAGCAASGAFTPDKDRGASASTAPQEAPEKPEVDVRMARLCPMFPLNKQAACIAALLQQ